MHLMSGRLKAMRDALLAQVSSLAACQPSLKMHLGWSDQPVASDHEVVSRIDSSSAASLSSSDIVVADDSPLEAVIQDPSFPSSATSEQQRPPPPPPPPLTSQDQREDNADDHSRQLIVKIISSLDAYQALQSFEAEGPDPDLIMVLSASFKLHGYPPHHSRASELVHCHMGRMQEKDAGRIFDQAVDRFLSTEQRFGR